MMHPTPLFSPLLIAAGLGCAQLPTPSPVSQAPPPTWAVAEINELQLFFADLHYATCIGQKDGIYLFRSGEHFFAATYYRPRSEGNVLNWINQAREATSRQVKLIPCPRANQEWSTDPCDIMVNSRDFPIAFVFPAHEAVYANR